MAVPSRLILCCKRLASLQNFCTKSTETELHRVSSALSSALPNQNSNGHNRNLQWVFLGCPGVGKGTYASRLSSLLGVPHISTGDLVRHQLSSHEPLSSQLAVIVNQGKLLADEIIFDLLSKCLEDTQTKAKSLRRLRSFSQLEFQWHSIWLGNIQLCRVDLSRNSTSRGKLSEFDLPRGIPESCPRLLHALSLDDH